MMKNDEKSLLSTLWVTIMINMIFNDIFSIFIELDKFEKVELPGDAKMTMLAAAFVTNIPLLMIILSKVLKYKINRWLNIAVGIFTIVYVWAGMAAYPHYFAVASIETILALFVIGIAWKWKDTVQA